MPPIDDLPVIVLTGFGPFGEHKMNDSWSAVRLVAQGDRGKQLEDKLNVRFVIKELPVSYEQADEVIPRLWADHSPLFTLHVGIHKLDSFKIETKSRRTNYDRKDVEGKTPTGFVCGSGPLDEVSSTLNLEELLSQVRSAIGDAAVEILLSDDPGNYLCGYSYFSSLCQDAGRALFLHIPAATEGTAPLERKADVVEAVVLGALDQIRRQSSAP